MMRSTIDRACARLGVSKNGLARVLDVHRNALSLAALKAQVGVELLEEIGRRAGLSLEEMVRLQLAWFEARAFSVHRRAPGREERLLQAIVRQSAATLDFMAERGLLEAYEREEKRRGRQTLLEHGRMALNGERAPQTSASGLRVL